MATSKSGLVKSDGDRQLDFDRELKWCIQSLEGCLKEKHCDPKSKKVFDVLNSSKASLVRKRQAMSNHFGDYRTLMRKEESKFPVVKPRISNCLITAPSSSCLFQKRIRKSSKFTDASKSFLFEFGPDSV